MKFVKGVKRPEKAGRKKGSLNKTTVAVKEMIIAALHGVGGQKYLEGQAKKNPTPFMGLVGKTMAVQLTGEGGGDIHITITKSQASIV